MKMLIGTREYDVPDGTTPDQFEIHGSGLVAKPGTVLETALKAEFDAEANAPRYDAGLTERFKLELAQRNLRALKDFMGDAQTAVVREAFRGEERQFFYDLVHELVARIAMIPKIRATDGQGDGAIAWLRYFAGGSAEVFVTEVDGEEAFGRADLYGDGGELGYISIAEVLSAGGELDFHFTPKPLKETK